MTISLEQLQQQVRAQKELIPSLYGDVDFNIVPERFTESLDEPSVLPKRLGHYRAQTLADKDAIARAKAYTMLGDNVADAYAALLPEYGFRRLIDMLKQACDHGLNSLDNPPPELTNFIQSMEAKPDWVDMKLVEEGARYTRIQMATLVPFAIRGAFIATFMNKYSGLPMAITGTLSGESAVQRVNETASFFTTASLPGALERYGVGFKAAAMVRLMHSMVRFNILKRAGDKWDINVYGIPIPQVDQMPAGTIPAFLTAFKVVSQKRKHFTRRERAIVELCRYQSYLLGLPEELLPETPEGIVNTMMTYSATLKEGYDDATCGELVRATMSGYRPKDHSLKSRLYNDFEKAFSKVFFGRVFLGSDKKMAKTMGVQPSPFDYLKFAGVSLFVLPQMAAHMAAKQVPVVGDLADKQLIHRINQLLVEYGHPEYTTDADKYAVENGSASVAAHG